MDIIKFENFKNIPEGWVNVKIDDQLFIRMDRYVNTLDKIVGIPKLVSKAIIPTKACEDE